MMEVWKPIDWLQEFSGCFEVSNLGNVRTTGCDRRHPHLMTPSMLNGYLVVCFNRNGVKKNLRVHRLVAQAFIPNPFNYPIVNHKDECKTNNAVDNLEWCDVKYNDNYGTRNERLSQKLSGRPHPWSVGRIVSEETRRKLSEGRKGTPKSEDTKMKISKALKGRYLGTVLYNNGVVTKRFMPDEVPDGWIKGRLKRAS